MTKHEAEEIFKRDYLPILIKNEKEGTGKIDKHGRRFKWSCFVDSLNKGGDITNNQAARWSAPRWLETATNLC
jgi:hypothetical protein